MPLVIQPPAILEDSVKFPATETMQRWAHRAILAGLLLILVIAILNHPIATNDGPVHVAFSHRILTMNQPGHPLQDLAYTVRLRPNPNLAVYLLMAALMRVFSVAVSESIVQILCIAGPVAAAWFALRIINPANAWLAIFILPLSMNQMFFFGLYNYCFSTAAFFLVIGAYFWMMKSPSVPRAAALSAALILTFLCHAGGFIMAFASLGVISATLALLSWSRDRQILKAIQAQRYALGAMLVPLPLAAIFLATGGRGMTMYGLWLSYRVKQFLTLHLLAVNHPTLDRFPAIVISILLLGSSIVAAIRIIRNRSGLPVQQRDQAIAVLAAGVAAIVIMLAFPDIMGGGWTHYRRFQIFPYFWALMLLAFESFSAVLVNGFFAVGAGAAVVFIASMVTRQDSVRDQLVPFTQVDHLIGNHCTVLPIMTRYRPVDAHDFPLWMQYQPLFQAASRLELTGDRVVLFNYLARLDAYPVHFVPSVEPQAHIFLWRPQQFETTVEKIDIPGFEKTSGLRVDYILLWGDPRWRPLDVQHQIQNALAGFRPIYKSSGGDAVLWVRESGGNSICEAVQAPTITARAN